jgi:hypothetical protein
MSNHEFEPAAEPGAGTFESEKNVLLGCREYRSCRVCVRLCRALQRRAEDRGRKSSNSAASRRFAFAPLRDPLRPFDWCHRARNACCGCFTGDGSTSSCRTASLPIRVSDSAFAWRCAASTELATLHAHPPQQLGRLLHGEPAGRCCLRARQIQPRLASADQQLHQREAGFQLTRTAGQRVAPARSSRCFRSTRSKPRRFSPIST